MATVYASGARLRETTLWWSAWRFAHRQRSLRPRHADDFATWLIRQNGTAPRGIAAAFEEWERRDT